MYIVAIAWLYVVVMMALAEALSPQGSVLGAFFTLVLYGALPVVVVLYIMGAPHRRRARVAAEREEMEAREYPDARDGPDERDEPAEQAGPAEPMAPAGPLAAAGVTDRVPAPATHDRPAAGASSAAAPPDGGGQPPRDALAPVRKEA